MIFQENATVIANKKIAHETYLVTFHAPKIAQALKPDQFVQLAPLAPDSILNRPMAAFNVNAKKGTVSVGFHVVGINTTLFAKLKKNDTLGLSGPFGKAFDFDLSYERYILVGGGIGITSLYFIGKYLKSKKKNLITLIGARNKSLVACESDFKKLGPVKIATDDGSRGYKGFVHELLKQQFSDQKTLILYCGPVKMMESCANVCNQAHIPHLAIMEEMMACGFGICVACVCQTTEGQKKVCMDGPIFDGSKLLWTREQTASAHE